MSPPISSTSSPASSTVPIPPRRKQRVSAEHTLNRVRENQRRHRARRRDHIATLEHDLAEAQQQLAEARAEIQSLKEERQSGEWRQRGTKCINGQGCKRKEEDEGALDERSLDLVLLSPVSMQSPSSQLPHQQQAQLQPLQQLPASSSQDTLTLLESINAPGPVFDILGLPSPPPPAAEPTQQRRLSGPAPCCYDPNEPPPDPSPEDDPECSSCATRPAANPNESTTLCSQAYVLIAQQNFRGIDAVTIRTWLHQGFRRAERSGEGCRVENTALMSLLDFISGV